MKFISKGITKNLNKRPKRFAIFERMSYFCNTNRCEGNEHRLRKQCTLTTSKTTMTNALKTYGWLAMAALWPTGNLAAQTFSIETVNDSLNYLTLKTDSTTDKWPLPYPVYRLDTADVNGDGRTEALVGVIKSTRFYPQKGRRLFVFKNYKNRVRAMWMGSKLGGILQDFRFVDGVVRSLETTTKGQYVVAEYRWQGFGFGFVRFLVVKVNREEALKAFNQ